MHHAIIGLLIFSMLLNGFSVSQAQTVDDVYVTTQDNAALRAGPGSHWDRLAVLPHSTTYHATGRTIDGEWIQIAYTGALDPDARTEFTVNDITYGWVAHWLLVWSGDILELPIDGIVVVPISRSAGPIIAVGPDSYIYREGIDPSTRVPFPLDHAVRVEVTGRLASAQAGHFWLQFKLNGQYYWTASWEVGIPAGYLQVPDRSYLYTYGRLLTQLRSELAEAEEVLNIIGGRWRALADGRTTTCNDIPVDFALESSKFSTADLNREPIYQPTLIALQSATTSINAALSHFREICQPGAERQVNPTNISAALIQVDDARRNLNLARTLTGPLQRRDPLLRTSGN